MISNIVLCIYLDKMRRIVIAYHSCIARCKFVIICLVLIFLVICTFREQGYGLQQKKTQQSCTCTSLHNFTDSKGRGMLDQFHAHGNRTHHSITRPHTESDDNADMKATPNQVEKLSTRLSQLNSSTLTTTTISKITRNVNPIPMNITIVKNIPILCKEYPDLQTIVYIYSSPRSLQIRHNIRTTWGRTTPFQYGRMMLIFLVGLPDTSSVQAIINEEHAMHRDIVQGDFLDTYRNLTLKGLLGLQWVLKYCSNAKLVLKVDGDAFVNTFLLQELMNKLQNEQKLAICAINDNMPIYRDPATCSKWCAQEWEFPGKKYYPRYCAGMAYMLTMDLIEDMYQATFHTPYFFCEDVYITGLLLANVKGVRYMDIRDQWSVVAKEVKRAYMMETRPRVMFVHTDNFEIWHTLWHVMERMFHQDTHKTESNSRLAILKRHLG